MIQANELRIGNWVNFGGIPMRVIAIKDDLKAEGIPLAPEILEKAGFEDMNDLWSAGRGTLLHYDLNDGVIQQAGFGPVFIPIAANIKHLHQLQNLYFACQGEELKIEL
jgi:hypothetical protein